MIKQVVKYQTDIFATDGSTSLVGAILCSTAVPLLSIAGDTNDQPESVDQNTLVPIRVSGTRKYGITARHLVLVNIVGTGATAFRVYRRVPILTPEFFNKAISQIPDEIDYESITTWTIAGAIGERYRLTAAPAEL